VDNALFTAFTVWCCFGCPKPVTALDPYTAHDEMEAHYTARHQARIDAITRPLPRWMLR
jgi:hypothetical protein